MNHSGSTIRAGFTLIELLIATTMIVLVLSFVVIGVEGLVPAYRVEAGAREVGATIAEAMSSAAVDGKRYGVVIDLENSEYWVMAPEETEEGELQDTAAQSREEDNEDPLAGTVALEPFRLHRGVKFSHVSFGGRKRSRGKVTVVFNPDGSGPPHAVCVSDGDGKAITVVVNPYTGTVDFLDGEKDLDIFVEEE